MQITRLKTHPDSDHLGITIPAPLHTIYGITINISPKCHVDVNHFGFCFRNKKGILQKAWLWGRMTSSEQYRWFKWYIMRVIAPLVDQGMFITAVCESGELHCHGYVVLHETPPRFNCIALLSDFRKQIERNNIVRRMTDDNQTTARRLNYIHALKSYSEWLVYMHDQVLYPPFELMMNVDEDISDKQYPEGESTYHRALRATPQILKNDSNI